MSCTKEDSLNSAEKNVVSDETSVLFEELLMLVNIKASDSSYLVVKSVDSIKIFINNKYWAKVNSVALDTAKVAKYAVGNKFESNSKISYLVMSTQDVTEPEYSTAGEFANYLNASYNLKPGEYACLIESFQVTLNDHTIKKYYPFKYIGFKVEESSKSAMVSEFDLNID